MKKIVRISMILVTIAILSSLLAPSAFAWDTNPHQGMAGRIADVFWLGTYVKNGLMSASTVPDTWGQDNIWDHAYLLDVPGWPNRAPVWANTFATNARDLFSQGQYDSAVANLGYASHYTADVSNPYHTSGDGLLFHNTYEPYVGANWNTGNNYQNSLSWGDAGYVTPSTATINTASNAFTHVGNIDWQMLWTGWQNNPSLVSDTQNSINVGSQNVNSLYYRMIGWV